MIITKAKPYKELTKELKKTDKIGIISCNLCARICGTGGPVALKKLAKKLAKDGYNVVDTDLIGVPCDIDQLQKNQLHGNTQIVLACDAGVYNLKQIFPKHKIISGLTTLGIGVKESGKTLKLIKKVCD